MQFHITTSEENVARQLDAASWGLFIIWIGLAILLNVGWAWGLLGVAAIILGGAALRWFKGLPVQWFWVAVGLMLLACAVWEFFALSLPLIPFLLIGFGVVVLAGAFRRPQSRT